MNCFIWVTHVIYGGGACVLIYILHVENIIFALPIGNFIGSMLYWKEHEFSSSV